jgi:putative DNA primase/helicase
MSAGEITALRLRVAANGFVPLPDTSPDYQHPKVKNTGKQPFFKGWNLVSAETITPEMIRGWERLRDHTNTGLITGALAGVDSDIRDPILATTIETLADTFLGPTPLVRIGLAPKQLRCYRHAKPLAKLETPELFLPDGTMAQVEIMGIGQQVVGFGIHPDTREPYRWLGPSPLDTRFEDIPVITEAAVRAFLAAAEAAIRAAGKMPSAKITRNGLISRDYFLASSVYHKLSHKRGRETAL